MSRVLPKATRVSILKRTAAHIRRWPQLYAFTAGGVPKKGEVCKACMLARAGVLMGTPERPGNALDRVARKLGFTEGSFYNTVRGVLSTRYGEGLFSASATQTANALVELAESL